MGSTRLPGKSMMDLAGAPLLGRILERVTRCARVDRIIVATTQLPEDNVLAVLARQYSVDVFRGSQNDLVDRYYQAAQACRAEVVVRLPADNPVPEPAEIDRIIDFHMQGLCEFSSNLAQVMGNGYPDGIGAEVFGFDSLAYIWKTCNDPNRREHLHLNFFDYGAQAPTDPARFRVGTLPCPPQFRRPDLVLDVNTIEQYEYMRRLYEYLYPKNRIFSIEDIIYWNDCIAKNNK